MKKLFFGSLMLLTILFQFCKTAKQASGSPEKAKTTIEANRSPVESDWEEAKKRWPSVTLEDLKAGYVIFNGECTSCHGTKNITKRSEENWLHEIDEMAPKAKLSAEQKEKLTRFILTTRAISLAANN